MYFITLRNHLAFVQCINGHNMIKDAHWVCSGWWVSVLSNNTPYFFRTAPGKTLPVSPVPPKSYLNRTVLRNTFHGGPVRDRRQPRTYNGPDQTQDTSAMNAAGRMSFFNKLSQKFSRRYVSCDIKMHEYCFCFWNAFRFVLFLFFILQKYHW